MFSPSRYKLLIQIDSLVMLKITSKGKAEYGACLFFYYEINIMKFEDGITADRYAIFYP